jgi:hypothetical protein
MREYLCGITRMLSNRQHWEGGFPFPSISINANAKAILFTLNYYIRMRRKGVGGENSVCFFERYLDLTHLCQRPECSHDFVVFSDLDEGK